MLGISKNLLLIDSIFKNSVEESVVWEVGKFGSFKSEYLGLSAPLPGDYKSY